MVMIHEWTDAAENEVGFMDRIVDLHVACLSFINALICHGHGKDLEFRVHMRYLFYQTGIVRAINVSPKKLEFMSLIIPAIEHYGT